MKISFYSTAWNVSQNTGFSFKDAFNNWFVYANEVCIAVPSFDDETARLIEAYAKDKSYNVVIVRPEFPTSDPFFYGKTLDSALQACSGDLLICQDLDERFSVDPARLQELYGYFQSHGDIQAFFVPTIDLYGSMERAAKIGTKWFIHKRGLKRGAVSFGIKENGRPDYNKTSSDELLDQNGNLVPTAALLQDLTIENLRHYANQGWPISYHLGYFDLNNRAERAKWWSKFWFEATLGDPNNHITDVVELEKRHTFEHGLPLWPTLQS
jgi:hypothetical protein